MSVPLRSRQLPYGYGSEQFAYQNYLDNLEAQRQQEANQRQREAEQLQNQLFNLQLQSMGQGYQNQAQGLYNQISTQQANERLAGLGLNFGQDTLQQGLNIGRTRGDIAQLGSQQRNQARSAQMDLARTQQGIRSQKMGAEEDLARLAYQRHNSEIQGPFETAKRLYGYS